MLILYNVKMDMAGGVDFSAANAKSSAQLRVKGESDVEHMHRRKVHFRLDIRDSSKLSLY